MQTTYGYDEAGRLTALRHELEAAMLAAYTYTLDAVGNRVQAGEEVSGTATTITYTYDALQRLTGADYSDGKDFTYAYDAAGNRTAYTETITQTGGDYVYRMTAGQSLDLGQRRGVYV